MFQHYTPRMGRFHFVGIGGIGMSGIAEILLRLGYAVSGSDMRENPLIVRLRALGAVITLGHAASAVKEAGVVVYSSAVSPDNPELAAARQQGTPLVRRGEMLAELMRLKYGIAIAGTHGKTTTTSLVAMTLAHAGLDPTVINGGILKAFGSNAHLGSGAFLVTEADESDGSFLHLSPVIAVVTNMDPEHMEHYRTFDAVRAAYENFVSKIPFYGLAVLCRDHPEVVRLLPGLRAQGRRVVTYGMDPEAHYQVVDIRPEGVSTRFAVRFRAPGQSEREDLGEVSIRMPGDHNVLNALAALAVARELQAPWPAVIEALAQFAGVGRRFDLLRTGPGPVVIDDYAHHPVEIQATLNAVRRGYNGRRLVAVFQPHRYSRVRRLLGGFHHCFGGADVLFLDRIYPAGESPPLDLPDHTGLELLMPGIQRHSGIEVRPLPLGEGWTHALRTQLHPEDVVVFMGAGDITQRARLFSASLEGP
jgi:UDP-N-acetylmuramate--alanine ligase